MSKPWRGFIALDGKKRAVQSFKGVEDSKLLSKAEAAKLDNYAGVLANDVVLLDFDDHDQADIALNIVKDYALECVTIKTTRGYHFLFRDGGYFPKNTVGQKLACGLKCDIKSGDRNAYEVLKFHGTERPVLMDQPGELPYAPAWFRPIDSDVELYKLGEGDGRNETLFGYMMTLTNRGFNEIECKDTAEVINQYVFAKPMDNTEFETVTRDEAFVLNVPTFKDSHGTFQHNEFGDWLLEHDHIIKIAGVLHVYRDGIYLPGQDWVERKAMEYIPNLTSAKRTEVFKYIDLKLYHDTAISDARYIPFQNGVYDIVDDELIPFSPDIVMTNRIPHDYNPNAKNPLIAKTLRKLACQDENLFNLLCEIVGYCFYRRSELGASFFLLGDNSNGKSTFISMLVYLLGKNNISALDLEDFNKEFRPSELFGKLANLGDDIGEGYISDTHLYKKIVTGNAITTSPKFEKMMTFEPYAKLIFSCNEMPKMNDKTGAVLRRMIPVTFNAKFSRSDPDFDPYIIYKLNSEDGAQTLINLGIEGLKRVLENHDFTKYKGMKAELDVIAENNNPLMMWVNEFGMDNIVNKSVDGVFREYSTWCIESQLKTLSKPTWKNQMKKKYELSTKRTKNPKDDSPVELFVKV